MSYWLTPYQEWFLWTQLACWFSWLSSKQEILICQWNQCLINSNTSTALPVALKSSWCQLMAPQFVLSTTCSESSVNKVGIMTTPNFQSNSQHPFPRQQYCIISPWASPPLVNTPSTGRNSTKLFCFTSSDCRWSFLQARDFWHLSDGRANIISIVSASIKDAFSMVMV